MVKVQEEIPLLEKDFDENLKAYKSTFLIEEEVAELAILEPAWAEYKASVAEIFSLNKAGETEKIFVSINTGGRASVAVSYTHLRAHETVLDLVCRLLLEKKKHTMFNH